MTDENTGTHSEDDDGDGSPAGLKQRAKTYAIAAYAWLRAQLAQSAQEIAPQLRGLSLPQVSGRALKSLVLAGLLIGRASCRERVSDTV